MESLGKITKKYGDQMYFVFRLLVGLMFFMHGAGKLFGWFGGPGFGFGGAPLMVAAGVLEFLIGLAIVFGLWTRLAALGGAVVMLVAYITTHLHWNPLASGGELAVMYFVAFLVLMVQGAGKWRLEKKEQF
jgi:putative oxidoreductase